MFDESGDDLNNTSSLLDDDFYSFLSISRQATSEEITAAFRKLSKLYHPDKHAGDEDKKKQAEVLFNKIKKAYDVLIDPQKRAIYDTIGVKGLSTEGWSLVERTKTPAEIREEYERLLREREERQLQTRTNPKGTIIVGINATDLFDNYPHYHDDDELSHFHLPHLEISSMSISQSIDAPLTVKSNLTMSGSLLSANGTGSGTVATSLRHVISSKTWTEIEFAAGQGPLVTMKGFRTLSNKMFSNSQILFHFTPQGIRPGISTVLARHLDKHLVGYLTWKAGIQSSMNTLLVWDSMRRHITASIQFGIPHSYASVSYTHKLELNETRIKSSIKGGTFGVLFEYGCETKLSQHSVIGATMVIGVPSGVSLKLRLQRANQSFLFPILLSDELAPNAIFYGTVAPLLAYYCARKLVIDPYKSREKEKEKQKMRQANASKIAEKRKEAESVVALMTQTYGRIVEKEKERNGLVVKKAIYGKKEVVEEIERNINMNHVEVDAPNIDESSFHDQEVLDVVIPLQCLVNTLDSSLTLTDSPKSQLPGFYDPCLGEEKKLFVRYLFRDKLHSVCVDDVQQLKLPNLEHVIHSSN